MAKYKRYRKYTRRARGRWSANITNIQQNVQGADPGSFYSSAVLCTNPVQNYSSVSQQFTVKNIETQFDLEAEFSGSSNNIENLSAYIMFLPQGYQITETLPFTHPEWIMAYRYYGSPNLDTEQPGRLPVKVKTRLSRRLQTGDAIIFLLTGTAEAGI